MQHKLYEHQEKQNNAVLKSLNKNNHVIYSAPVGFGKENCMGHLIKGFLEDNKRVLVLAPFRTLLFQLEEGFKEARPYMVMGNIKRGDINSGLILSTPHTMNNRMKDNCSNFENIDIILIDEMHINYIGMMKDLKYKYWNTAKWIGFSGTPIKANGEKIKGWDKAITLYQIPDLIKTGYLAEYDYLAPYEMDISSLRVDSKTGDYNASDVKKLVSDTSAIQSVVNAYNEYSKDRKTLIFAANIEHSILLSKALPNAMVIHSKISEAKQRKILEDYKNSKNGILINVTMLTTGYNEPSIECLIIARPIKSIPKGIQVWGRGLREFKGRKTTIIDLASVYKNVGLPNEVRDFEYVKPPFNGKYKSSFMFLACSECKNVFNVANLKRQTSYTEDNVITEFFCPECNHMFKHVEKELSEVGRLKLIQEAESNKKFFWTHELVKLEALKYRTRKEFSRKSSGGYTYSRNKDILEEVCSHMKKANKHSCETVKQEALKYKTRIEFRDNNGGAYQYACKHKLLDEVCKHMEVQFFYTKEFCHKKALMYKTRREFKIAESGAYFFLQRIKAIDEVCSHMPKPFYWTKELCQIESIKYIKRHEFRLGHCGAYSYACDNNILDEVCSHMDELNKITRETVKQKALKYKARGDFQKREGSSYNYALKHNILDEVCKHMIYKNVTWTHETVLKEALKYEYRNKFRKGKCSAYNYASRNNILDEICSHMKRK